MKLTIVAIWFIVSQAACLNIVLSTTDSWVSKNVRFLYQSLKDQNHNVKLIGPLYKTRDGTSPSDWEEGTHLSLISENIDDGGDFGYLLPVHQSYYGKLRRVNTRRLKAKGVIPMQEIKREEENIPAVQNKYYGRDPLDNDIWYVNSTPLNTLLVGLDIILESYYPDFVPDLLIVGPNEEDIAFESKNIESDFMVKVGMMKNISSIEVTLEETRDIYFQDEKYFTIQSWSADSMLRNNFVSSNVKFVNRKIGEFIENFNKNFQRKTAKIRFPKLSYDSTACQLYADDQYNPKFFFESSISHSKMEYTVDYPKFVYNNEKVMVDRMLKESYFIGDGSSKSTEKMSELSLGNVRRHYDNEHSFNSDMSESNEIQKEVILSVCKISLDVQEMEMFESSESVF